MGSRSTSGKLKVMFLANIVIVAFAVGGYVYVNSLIPDPASFQVTDLTLEQTSVQLGEPIQISVNVTNVGEEIGNYSVTLTIDNEPTDSKTVQLSGGETAKVNFSATGIAEGNHTVQIGDMNATFTITLEAPPTEADIRVTYLGISRTQAMAGETIVVSATARNFGDKTGSYSMVLLVNGKERETRNIQLEGGKTTTERFDVVEQAEGTYVVKVGDLTKSFEITSEAKPPAPAEFQVSNLEVNPTTALANEAVEISVTVMNIGEESGSHSLNLIINGVIRDTQNVELSGGATIVVEFQVTEANEGTYNVEVDGLSSSFTVAGTASSNIILNRLIVSPYEIWGGETVTIKALTQNLGDQPGTLHAQLKIKDEVQETRAVTFAAGESKQIEFTTTAEYTGTGEALDGYSVKMINVGNQSNVLSGYFVVAPDGYHTLIVTASYQGMKFTLDGVEYGAPFIELLPVGTYTVVIPDAFEYAGTFWNFTNWQDTGSTSLTRTVTLNSRVSLNAQYMNTKSCPSLYVWDGNEYLYTAEISDGTGYLGIFDHFQEDGSLVFLYSVPWDYTKLNASRIQPKNGYYDMLITQKWDEISYVDSAVLVVVDHAPNVDVFSTKPTYLYDLLGQGEIYTVSTYPQPPVSCVNSTGHDLLSLILERDGLTTLGNEFQWDMLELDLGDLSNAEEIKLVVAGTIVYSTGEEQGAWAGQFWDKPGEKPFPPPYMEVKDANGNWVPVPDDRQFPLLDVTPNCFVVNLTGLFPTNDYSIRIHTFFNTRFDYIGVDTTPQQEIIIREVLPAYANLSQAFATSSASTGNFTRYGDVTELMRYADNKYLIGRQGDEIHILFPADIDPVAGNMERDYFLFASVWFKVDGLPYLSFTVDPLPFHNMSSFPYPPTESYPYEDLQDYLLEYNTRTINAPAEEGTVGLIAFTAIVLCNCFLFICFNKFKVSIKDDGATAGS